MTTKTLIVAAKFFSLAETAAKNGGFWVSSAGGTANVVAGVIARSTGVSFEGAMSALEIMGRESLGNDWYQSLAEMQPFRWDDWHDEEPPRWDARTIARAACRGVA